MSDNILKEGRGGLKGCNVSCQNWSYEKESATWPTTQRALVAWSQVSNNGIILKVGRTTTVEPFDLQRLLVPL